MATTKTAFDLQVIACHTCGAPLEMGAAGGVTSCSFCRHEQHSRVVRTRVEFGWQADEPQRLAMLAQQDARPPQRKWIAALLVGDELLPWKLSEALDRYRALHDTLREGAADGATQEQLWELTMVLTGYFGAHAEPLRERALLEGALEVLADARHRQTIYAALATSAARAGDQAAAASWLSLCDPRSSELRSDSAFRFARAYLDTTAGRWQQVLDSVGNGWQGVPLSNEIESYCVALRAHAWEQLGQPTRAIDLLDHYLQQVDGYRRFQVRRFAHRQPSPLCSHSLPQAEERQRRRGVALLGKTSGSPKLSLTITLAFLAATVVATPIAGYFGGVGWGVYAVGMGAVLVSAFLTILLSDRRAYRRAVRLRNEGLLAVASTIHVRSTGRATNGVPELSYRLLIIPPESAAFEAYNTLHADHTVRRQLAPGRLVMVRFDPTDWSNVHVEVD
jgi:hypothetical protein